MNRPDQRAAARPCAERTARRRFTALAWVGLGVLMLATASGAAQSFSDNFSNRQVISNSLQGRIEATNTLATVEPLEPKHAGKTGGHSLWISWIAPSNGVVEFKTEGSGFDTLLAAYVSGATNGGTFADLTPLVSDDDDEAFEQFESEITFGVLAGQRYEIAVDGYFGARGNVEFEWRLQPTTVAPPTVLGGTADRSVKPGDPLTISVILSNAGNAQLKWFHNTNELGITATNLFLTNVQPADAGRYRLRVDVAGVRYFTQPVEIQLNTDDATNALARDKVFDALGSPLTPSFAGIGYAGGVAAKGGADAGGVVRGFNGSQIFDTTYATFDPAEPAHCGATNGTSYWFAYEAPTNGTVTLDTLGSGYDTVLTAYTFDPPLTNYAGLIPLVCDDNSAVTNGAARVTFAVLQGRQYAVVVTGVNGARGLAQLNYALDSQVAPVPPTLTQAPPSQNAAAGATVSLTASVIGSAPLRYRWSKAGAPLPAATNAQLQLAGVALADSGDYVLTVSNHVGAPLDVTLPLQVIVTPHIQFSAIGSGENATAALAFLTATNRTYTVEQADAVTGPWTPLAGPIAGTGLEQMFTNASSAPQKFFRIRVE